MWPVFRRDEGPLWLGLSTSPSLEENYEVLGCFAHGRFGKVFQAKHRGTGMLVAVKELLKAKVRAVYIISEVENLRGLQHPNFVQLLEVIETYDKVYLVLEYVTGGNLRQRILRTENHRLPEEEARGIFRDIVGAMDYCHTQGIVHGDLKPQNVLIDSQGHAKICDLGAGCRFLPGKEVFLLYGTLKYCAPERLLHERMRPTVQEVLQHQWLQGVPTPSPPELLPMPPQMAILNITDGTGFNLLKVIDSMRRKACNKEMATFLLQSQALQGGPLRIYVNAVCAPDEDTTEEEIASPSTAPAPSSHISRRSASAPVTFTGLLFPGMKPTGRQGGGDSQPPSPIPRTNSRHVLPAYPCRSQGVLPAWPWGFLL
ncbi:Sperm motility kinase 3 [Heterocephalus glaber]|uniref:non-specific serine/threonine protein kinase n=1 Tax=Heterocephalus glaber TaxID=10181 RepID=G5B5Z3_HETGA|nr:Sperm motility kinase 3 [Heterocephalus glaber]